MTNRQEVEAILSERRSAAAAAEFAEVADSLRVKQERQAAEGAQIARLEQKRAAAHVVRDRILQRLSRLQLAMGMLREETQDVLGDYAELGRLCCDLSGATPLCLSNADVANAIGAQISATMSAITGHHKRLGTIEWNHKGAVSPKRDLRKMAAAQFLQHVDPIIIGERKNGTGSSSQEG